MKRAIIVHGWGGNPTEGWIPWLKGQLEDRGFGVAVPEMPDTMHPKIVPWVEALRELVGVPDAELVLIGHSIGCQTILRYLESVDTGIARAVLVAPWVGLVDLGADEDWDIAKPWLETPINFESARLHCAAFTLLFSDNDPFVPMSNKEVLQRALGGESIVFHAKGHLSEGDGVMELPEIIFAIEK